MLLHSLFVCQNQKELLVHRQKLLILKDILPPYCPDVLPACFITLVIRLVLVLCWRQLHVVLSCMTTQQHQLRPRLSEKSAGVKRSVLSHAPFPATRPRTRPSVAQSAHPKNPQPPREAQVCVVINTVRLLWGVYVYMCVVVIVEVSWLVFRVCLVVIADC